MDKTCNTFGIATSPIVSDLSTSFNGKWIWTCGLAHHHYFWHSVHSISGALNEHYLRFWALNRALNAKKQGTLKALLNPNFTSTKLLALVYNFRKEFERYKAGPVRREPCLVESSTEWIRSLPLSWVRWSTVTGCKSFFYRFFFMVLVLSYRECCPSAKALNWN